MNLNARCDAFHREDWALERDLYESPVVSLLLIVNQLEHFITQLTCFCPAGQPILSEADQGTRTSSDEEQSRLSKARAR